MNRSRIWKIGLGKTGTTSLHLALGKLGLASCHNNTLCDRAAVAATVRSSGGVLDEWQAFTDGEEAARQYKLIYRRNPEDKFILTTRHVEHWLDSKLISTLMHRVDQPSKAGRFDIDTKSLRKQFNKHVTDVTQFFADKPGALLVFNCCDGKDGYEELISFLKLRSPEGMRLNLAWPRSNPSENKLVAISKGLANRGKR